MIQLRRNGWKTESFYLCKLRGLVSKRLISCAGFNNFRDMRMFVVSIRIWLFLQNRNKMNTNTLLSGVVIITSLSFSSCSKDAGIVLVNPPIECPSTAELYLLNSFSPPADMLKIHYGNIQCIKQCIKTFELVIYNRWGEKVFESSDANFQWDGTYQGNPENKGVYVYIMTATLISGEEISKRGNISLLR